MIHAFWPSSQVAMVITPWWSQCGNDQTPAFPRMWKAVQDDRSAGRDMLALPTTLSAVISWRMMYIAKPSMQCGTRFGLMLPRFRKLIKQPSGLENLLMASVEFMGTGSPAKSTSPSPALPVSSHSGHGFPLFNIFSHSSHSYVNSLYVTAALILFTFFLFLNLFQKKRLLLTNLLSYLMLRIIRL